MFPVVGRSLAGELLLACPCLKEPACSGESCAGSDFLFLKQSTLSHLCCWCCNLATLGEQCAFLQGLNFEKKVDRSRGSLCLSGNILERADERSLAL